MLIKLVRISGSSNLERTQIVEMESKWSKI
jgi:hypothetical protein